MCKIKYDEKFVALRIKKLRDEDQIDDIDSVHHIKDSELPEEITKVGFSLDCVQAWEEYTDPFKIFENTQPKVRAIIYGYGEPILLMSFDEFDQVMDKFIKKQQENG